MIGHIYIDICIGIAVGVIIIVAWLVVRPKIGNDHE